MKVKALYTFKELAVMAGVDEKRLRRWVASRRMSVVRHGRSSLVPLFIFRDAFPQIWEAIKMSQSLTSGRCQACNARIEP